MTTTMDDPYLARVALNFTHVRVTFDSDRIAEVELRFPPPDPVERRGLLREGVEELVDAGWLVRYPVGPQGGEDEVLMVDAEMAAQFRLGDRVALVP